MVRNADYQEKPLSVPRTFAMHFRSREPSFFDSFVVRCISSPPGGGVLIYFSVLGRSDEQSIIFRIRTPGQDIIFVKIGSMTGSIFVILDSERSF